MLRTLFGRLALTDRSPSMAQTRQSRRRSLESLEPRCLLTTLVTTAVDVVDGGDGVTSLREAITTAANQPGDDTITFADGLETVTLGGQQLTLNDVTGTISIDGGGDITIDAQGASRAFFVQINTTVNLEDLTITGGSTEDFGGAIFNQGVLTISNAQVQDNVALRGGGIFSSGSMRIEDSQIQNNLATDPTINTFGGGGILNRGNLEIHQSTLTGNTAVRTAGNLGNEGGGFTTISDSTVEHGLAGQNAGGIGNRGIRNQPGQSTLVLTGSTLRNNAAEGSGGGIVNFSQLEVNTSTIVSNSANELGGGIFNGNTSDGPGVVSIDQSTVAHNSAEMGGGGLANQRLSNGSRPTLTVTNSTIASNLAQDGHGGGILGLDGTRNRIYNTTISGNVASGHGGGIGLGNNDARATTSNATITQNVSGLQGGGIFVNPNSGIVLRNTIVGENEATVSAPDFFGTAFAEESGWNLIRIGQDSSGLPPGRGNLVGTFVSPVDPQLGPLKNNGGPTLTHALLPGSPALDAGWEDYTNTIHVGQLLNDQRGNQRSEDANAGVNPRVDIGALESEPIASLVHLEVNGTNENDLILLATEMNTVTNQEDLVITVNGEVVEKVSIYAVTLASDNLPDNDIASITINGLRGNDTIDGSSITVPMLIRGGGGSDLILGGAGADEIRGANGDDTLEGNSGHDTLVGGGDQDVILAGDGDDFVNGDQRPDLIDGGLGNDTLIGRGGNDTIDGGLGDDSIRGSNDDDLVFGGHGDDTLEGNNSRDTLNGGLGHDSISGGQGEDDLFGNAGHDTLVGGKGRNQIEGGSGNDLFWIRGGILGQEHLLDRSPGGAVRHRQFAGDGAAITIDLVNDYNLSDLVLLEALGGDDTVTVDADLTEVRGILDGGSSDDHLQLPTSIESNWTVLNFESFIS